VIAGKAVSPERLAEIFKELVEKGAHNINLVSPTPYVPAIIKALRLYQPPVPVVYNSSGYERVETLRSLDGLIDIYLPDFKYLSPALSASLSGAEDYATAAEAAIREMARQTGPMVLDKDGIAVRGTMVRHLVLPGHTKESIAVLGRLRQILPDGVWLSLLFQYTPVVPVEGFPSLSRRLTKRECDKVWQYFDECGFTDGYVQDRESAGTAMIPLFDNTGV
jgi:putative pyruvate formate lyase activating enzyme